MELYRHQTEKKVKENEEWLTATLSGYSDTPIATNFKQYGFRGMIHKPYDIQKLGEVLQQVIG